MFTSDYNRDPSYRCSGGCGAPDCRRCYPPQEDAGVYEALTRTQKRAYKGRFKGTPSEIRKGDLVEVTTGFRYLRNGARVGYVRARYRRLEKGPGWDNREG